MNGTKLITQKIFRNSQVCMTVMFYGEKLSKNDCIESKLSLFKEYDDFYQQIFGEIQVENISDSSVKCNFIKRVTVNQETKDYPAYLTFMKIGFEWKISIEGDLTTDKNLTIKNLDKLSSHFQSGTLFVKGLNAAKVFTSEEAEKGGIYNYIDGITFKIESFFNQVDVMFYSKNESNNKESIHTEFEVGYESDGEIANLKKTSNFLIGQFDFDADDIDELVIAIQDNDENGENGICVNVFKLKNDKWERIGVLTGIGILGEPNATVKMNTIKIERNLRNFYYKWILENEEFKDIGEY